jgi:hypothetical protein
MTWRFSVVALPVALLALGVPATPADKPEGTPKAASKLDGAWRLVGVRAGEEYSKPESWDQYKLVVGGRFIWTSSQDGKILYAAGGRCTVEGDRYTEFIEYAHERPTLVGKEAKFTWKLDGDKWYHKGTIKTDEGDIPIDELWERVKK